MIVANTYWEKRCMINEMFVDHMFNLIYGTLSAYDASVASEIQDAYFEAINKLVAENEKKLT